jgi:methionine-rich copper-binding protein CopC
MTRSRTTRAMVGTWPLRLAAGVLALEGVLCVDVAVGASTGWAHGSVEATTPRAGERLASPPVAVRVEFSSRLRGAGGSVVVEDSAGRNWAAGPASVDAATLSQRVDPRMPGGDYQARWKAVAADGAPLHGVLRFTVGAVPGNSNPLNPVVTAERRWLGVTGSASRWSSNVSARPAGQSMPERPTSRWP